MNKRTMTADLGKVFDKHVRSEFEVPNIEITMKTMIKQPYVHHVPVLTGGVGYDGVYNFYKKHLVGKMPKDTKFERVSRTIGKDQVVDELILKFTHDREIDFMLPDVPPTGNYVELPLVVVVKFKGSKIVHEHIYWDQASLLSQIGLLTMTHLPITGIQQSKRLHQLATTLSKNVGEKRKAS